MKMKELVIKIPEDMYNLIMKNVKVVDALTLLQEREVFIKAIQNGTVLPEKHDGQLSNKDITPARTGCGMSFIEKNRGKGTIRL